MWAYGCVSASVYLCMSVFFFCALVHNGGICIYLYIMSINVHLHALNEKGGHEHPKVWMYLYRNSAVGMSTVQDDENMFTEKFVFNSVKYSGEKVAFSLL